MYDLCERKDGIIYAMKEVRYAPDFNGKLNWNATFYLKE